VTLARKRVLHLHPAQARARLAAARELLRNDAFEVERASVAKPQPASEWWQSRSVRLRRWLRPSGQAFFVLGPPPP